MYFIEFIIKKLTGKKEEPTYDPRTDDEFEDYEDYEVCEHTFMPVDSTGEMLSCTKCGILVKRSELKNKNFFMNN